MKQKEIKNIKNFLVDMDGTTYIGSKPIPGAKEFFDLLRNQNKQYIFVTNNSSEDSVAYKKKLSRFGIKISSDNIFTSSIATGLFLKEKGLRNIYLLGTDKMKKDLLSMGMNINEKKPDCVVLGFDKTVNYKKLEKACLLIEGGLPFIASHPDIFCPTEYGNIPDCGAISMLIELTTKVSPIVIGKPSRKMSDFVINKFNLKRNETALIGDRLYTDIKMGKDAKITTILVLSGETKKKDLKNKSIKPDFIFNSLKELKNYLESDN